MVSCGRRVSGLASSRARPARMRDRGVHLDAAAELVCPVRKSPRRGKSLRALSEGLRVAGKPTSSRAALAKTLNRPIGALPTCENSASSARTLIHNHPKHLRARKSTELCPSAAPLTTTFRMIIGSHPHMDSEGSVEGCVVLLDVVSHDIQG